MPAKVMHITESIRPHTEQCLMQHFGVIVFKGKPYIEISCATHKSFARVLIPKLCYCRTPGFDDGDTTCFKHHDCSDGSCTHQDVD